GPEACELMAAGPETELGMEALRVALDADGAFEVPADERGRSFWARRPGTPCWRACTSEPEDGEVLVHVPSLDDGGAGFSSGRLAGLSLEELRAALPWVSDARWQYFSGAVFAPDGRFRVGPLPAGTYRIGFFGLDPCFPPLDLGEVRLGPGEERDLGE